MKRNKIILALFALMVSSAACKRESVYVSRRLPQSIITAGDARLIPSTLHLSKDTAYVLATDLVRDSGQVLSIEAGTLVKVMDKLSIVIHPGAAIDARGTEKDPIVFTSSAVMGSAGAVVIGTGYDLDHYWYGIRIYGSVKSSANSGSGVLAYARIEFAGGNFNSAGWPSLLLQNVSKQTTLENIQVSYSYANAAFEFYGGDCSARNLVSYAGGNSDLYLHQGYKGMLQNILAYRHPYFPVASNSFASLYIADTATLPVISNLTVLGPGLQSGTSDSYLQSYNPGGWTSALTITGGARFHIGNSVFAGFPRYTWYLSDGKVVEGIINDQSDLTHSVFQHTDSTKAFYLKPGTYGGTTSSEFRSYVLQSSFANRFFLSFDDLLLTDPYNYNVRPDPLPKTGSPLLSGASFDGAFSDPFFKTADHCGALGADNWLQGWTNFLPLQTNYNN